MTLPNFGKIGQSSQWHII